MAVRHAAYDAEGKPLPGETYFIIYVEFLRELLAFRESHPALYSGNPTGVLHIIGESHSLTPAHLVLGTKRVVPHLIMGGLAYMFTVDHPDSWRYALKEIIRKIPKEDDVIVCFGEIDCRPGSGIMAQAVKHADYALDAEIDTLAENYVRVVKRALLRRLGCNAITGVPAPKRTVAEKLNEIEVRLLPRIIRQFNAALAREATRQELGFVDLYAATVDGQGWAKENMHLDHVHLHPDIVAGALQAALAA